jgi:hypothetical protein
VEDIREVDTKLGPMKKWDRKKLLKGINIIDPKTWMNTEVTQRASEDYMILPDDTKVPLYVSPIQYVKEKDFGSYPHPRNYDIPDDFTTTRYT